MNALKKWDNVTIVDKVIVESGVTFCPYVFPGRFTEALDTVPGSSESSIIFCHQEFRGCDMGVVKSVDGDDPDKFKSLVVSGHIHDNQRLSKNIYYVGAPLQHTFSEKEKRVLFVLDGTQITEIPVRIGLKRNIHSTCSETASIDLKSIDCNVETRLVISGSVTECKSFKRTAKYKNLIKKCKVIFRTTSEVLDTVKSEYRPFTDVCTELIGESKNKNRLSPLLVQLLK